MSPKSEEQPATIDEIFAPPAQARIEKKPADLSAWTDRAKSWRRLALVPLGIVGLIIVLSPLLVRIPGLATAAALGGVFLAVVAAAGGLVTAIRIRMFPEAVRPEGIDIALAAIPLSFISGFVATFVAAMTAGAFIRGRQLRRLGRPRFAELEEGAWTKSVPPQPVPAPREAAIAWRHNGLTEHASIGAFALLSKELIALGAPLDLSEDCHRDALDEIRHARLCFDLARDIDGRDVGPATFKAMPAAIARGPRALRLSRLAVDALIDGCLNEGMSARVVASLAKEVEEPRIRSVLEEIASDEARHAAHAFGVLRWCLKRGGRPVQAALTSALEALPETLGSSLHPHGEDGSLERYGIPGRDRELREFEVVRARLVERTRRLL